ERSTRSLPERRSRGRCRSPRTGLLRESRSPSDLPAREHDLLVGFAQPASAIRGDGDRVPPVDVVVAHTGRRLIDEAPAWGDDALEVALPRPRAGDDRSIRPKPPPMHDYRARRAGKAAGGGRQSAGGCGDRLLQLADCSSRLDVSERFVPDV